MSNNHKAPTWEPVTLTAAHANNPLQVLEYSKSKGGVTNDSLIGSQVQAKAVLSGGEKSTLGGSWV
jgi:hypothetical protein